MQTSFGPNLAHRGPWSEWQASLRKLGWRVVFLKKSGFFLQKELREDVELQIDFVRN